MTYIKPTIYILLLLFTASCSKSTDGEIFEEFYSKFKADEKLKLDRTIFPVKVTIHTGYNNPLDSTTRIEYFTKDDVIKKKKLLYANEKIVKSQGYLHIIRKESDSNIFVLIGRERSETAVAYGFKIINKKWFLVEFINYWGS